jgi:molybdenum cofactor cytidylyltransferase
MRLIDALRLNRNSRLALTGAGGKSSALFRLANEYLGKAGLHELTRDHNNPATISNCVFLAASTHLAVKQLSLADRHIILGQDLPSDRLWEVEPDGITLFTGPQVESDRTSGVSMRLLDRLCILADELRVPFLIEADGSRQRPMKAPASHEPVIPEWVDSVAVVAGLSGLGKLLSADWVHRPELFGEIAGISKDQAITLEALTAVISHPSGGLKGIPESARRSVLLNQASSAERIAAAQRMAKLLLPIYQAVVIADIPYLQQPDETAEQGTIFSVHERIAGIILAAGASNRLGRTKQLLKWRGQPLVWHAASTALAGGLSPVIVVTGHKAGEIRSALGDLPVKFAHNPAWRDGQSSSVVAGITALPSTSGAAVFLLADQPHVTPSLISSLMEAHAVKMPPVIAPMVGSQRANPTLFDRTTFEDLRSLKGDVGGRALFDRYPPTWLEWHDSKILLDIDTEDDYLALLESAAQKAES